MTTGIVETTLTIAMDISTALAIAVRTNGEITVKSIDKKNGNKLVVVVSMNEIASIFAVEKNMTGKKRLIYGRLSCIISEVELRNDLTKDLTIKVSCIGS